MWVAAGRVWEGGLEFLSSSEMKDLARSGFWPWAKDFQALGHMPPTLYGLARIRAGPYAGPRS